MSRRERLEPLADGPVGVAESLAHAQLLRLIRAGVLQDHHWRDALAAHPRHLFLGGGFYERAESGWRHVDAGARGFLPVVHSGRALVTAVSPLDAWGRQVPVSVSPPTELLVWSLQALGLYDGATVLELGTGTGHATALLTHRLGADRVTSAEIDPDLHRRAARVLHALGQRPTLLRGDSAALGRAALGPGAAGVDRILAGHEVPTVPPGWADLLHPDGAVLVRVSGGLGAGGHLLLLRPPGSVETLTGRFLGWTGPTSPHRALTRLPRRAPTGRAAAGRGAGWAVCTGDTPYPPDALTAPDSGTLALLAQLLLPPGTRASRRTSPAASTDPAAVTHLQAPDGSWAQIHHGTDRWGRYDTRWAGPTRLLAAVDAAHQVHHDLGAPPVEAFGLTADPHGVVVWHDDARTGPRWPLPDLDTVGGPP